MRGGEEKALTMPHRAKDTSCLIRKVGGGEAEGPNGCDDHWAVVSGSSCNYFKLYHQFKLSVIFLQYKVLWH